MKHYEYEISLYVDDELPPDKKEELLTHIAVCKKCKKTFREYTGIKENLTQFYQELPSRPNLFNTFSIKENNFIRRSSGSKLIVPLTAAASIVLVFLLIGSPGVYQQKDITHPIVENKPVEKKLNSKNKLLNDENRMSEDRMINTTEDYNLMFNEVINQAIEAREKQSIPIGLQYTGYDIQQLEFNGVINLYLDNDQIE